MELPKINLQFFREASRPDLIAFLVLVMRQDTAVYQLLDVAVGNSPLGALENWVAQCSEITKRNLVSVMADLTNSMIQSLGTGDNVSRNELANCLSFIEMLMVEGEGIEIDNSPILQTLGRIAELDDTRIQADAVRVLSQTKSLYVVHILSGLHKAYPRRREIAQGLLLAKSAVEPSSALDVKFTRRQLDTYSDSPDFALILETVVQRLFEHSDVKTAYVYLIKVVRKWPILLKETVVQILRDPPLSELGWAMLAAGELGLSVKPAEVASSKPSRPPPTNIELVWRNISTRQVRLQGNTLGSQLFSSYSVGERGQLRFQREWHRFQKAVKFTDKLRPKWRLLLMSALRRFNESRITEEYDEAQIRLAKRGSDTEGDALRRILGFGEAVWPRARRAFQDLQRLVDAANAESWRDDVRGPPLLSIGIGAYPEEGIAAQIVADLCGMCCDTPLFTIVHAPWGQRKVIGSHSQLNETTGGADIRFINLASISFDKPLDVGEQPIFRHCGYRAYASFSWLQDLKRKNQTPPEVSAWIGKVAASKLGDRTLCSPETLPERAWLALKGHPINYDGTEFTTLLSYLSTTARTRHKPISVTRTRKRVDPDSVFEEFILGDRGVLMSGSVHDMLLDEYWIKEAKDFVPLLRKRDFKPLYDEADQRLGFNSLAFSDRLQPYPDIRNLVRELFSMVFEVLVKTMGSGTESRDRHGLLEYVGKKLMEGPQSSSAATGAPRWSFPGSKAGLIKLLTEDTQLVGPHEVPSYSGKNVVSLRRNEVRK